MTPTVSINATFGMWMVSFFLDTMLYGCSLLQIWLYFYWYPLDHWMLKTMVVVLTISETLQIVFLFVSTYNMFITHFGNLDNLLVVNWMDTVRSMRSAILIIPQLTGSSAGPANLSLPFCNDSTTVSVDKPPLTWPITVVTYLCGLQLFCALHLLNRKKKAVPILIVSLSLIAMGAGIAQDVVSTILNNFSKLGSTTRTDVLQGAASLSCDIVITLSLLFTLNDRKTEAKKWSTKHPASILLNTLMVIAINRGVATAIFSAVNIILFLSMPNTFWFFLGLIPSSKLYMNSAMGTLNSRQYLRSKSDAQNWRILSLQCQNPVISDARGGDMHLSPMENPIRIHMHTETHISEPHAEETAKTDTTV
ncbi:hypothetical protein CVT26_014643 [Gymnopilus dilepis]|uniref:DUF6534 domain-containing protein n=1 Tax=Gymnopilus dilepis TaxID=231916 RepID=A0A409W3H9_9AGAR|nr:hypothetical protein CVT26_014643 [Gymnopilus dilepis]